MFVHHQVMWYMILILAVVYWSFFRIIREYNWHSFSRRQGYGFLVRFHDLRFFELDQAAFPLWASLAGLWLNLLRSLSGSLLAVWLNPKANGFWGYQS